MGFYYCHTSHIDRLKKVNLRLQLGMSESQKIVLDYIKPTHIEVSVDHNYSLQCDMNTKRAPQASAKGALHCSIQLKCWVLTTSDVAGLQGNSIMPHTHAITVAHKINIAN